MEDLNRNPVALAMGSINGAVSSLLFVGLALGFTACSDDEEPLVEPVAVQEQKPFVPPTLALKTVYFGFDEYTLSTEAQATLNSLADALKVVQGNVQIEGHTDEHGSNEYNLALGELRAQSVKGYLVTLGVEAARLPTISYGEEKPADKGHNKAAWSKNRRAEFVH